MGAEYHRSCGKAPLWVKIVASPGLAGAVIYIAKEYFKMGSYLDAIKQTVYAGSDADMERILQGCTKFEHDL